MGQHPWVLLGRGWAPLGAPSYVSGTPGCHWGRDQHPWVLLGMAPAPLGAPQAGDRHPWVLLGMD